MNGVPLSNRDFLAGKIVEPAYYDVVIEEVEESLSKAGDSTNFVLKGSIEKNADTGSVDFAGVPIPRWAFNTKAQGFVIPLFESIGQPLKVGDIPNYHALKGVRARLWIGNDEYEGRPVNSLGKVPKYRPING